MYVAGFRYKKRRIALRFLYLGWDYQGFAAQENTVKTIEVFVLSTGGFFAHIYAVVDFIFEK